ncbi:hypothetical protein [Nocardioides ferulae]|uniref:hypothetical protein n=1 Tax=Nocardioides ferulae TaxID=2340821 RepID=UPI000EB38465|nr:hypothetical protein [Nocardioides ferulae]
MSTRLHVRAHDGNAMLGRIVAALGQHEVDHFSYSVGREQQATAVIGVRGGSWQVDRVAARVLRLVGVLEVVVDPPAPAPAPAPRSEPEAEEQLEARHPSGPLPRP